MPAEIISPPAPAAPAAPKPSAPAPAPAAPAPAAPPAAPSSGGMRDFISNMGKKPEPKPSDDTPPAATKPADVSPVPAAVTTPADDHPDITDAVWDKAPKNLKNAYFKTRRELQEKLTANENRLKELESKSSGSPADVKRIKELEERSAKLEKDLEEREQRILQTDYRSSKEFREKYELKGQRAYKQAIDDVKRLKVKQTDESGTETLRPATEEDFAALRSLPPFEQDQKINEMFGTSAWRVSNHMRSLENLEQEANEALASAKTKAEESRRNFEKQSGERNAEFKAHSDRAIEELQKAHANFFAPDPANPEATAALERGLKFVDDSAADGAKMSPKDLAETTAMIRFLAGSAPRLMTEVNQLKAQIAAKDEELAKYRKSSPGSAPSPTGAPKAAPVEEKRGIGAIKEMLAASAKR